MLCPFTVAMSKLRNFTGYGRHCVDVGYGLWMEIQCGDDVAGLFVDIVEVTISRQSVI